MPDLEARVRTLERFVFEDLPGLVATVAADHCAGRMRYRGVFESGTAYQRGDVVTKAGSLWCCMADTVAPPGSCQDWRLAVKSGQVRR